MKIYTSMFKMLLLITIFLSPGLCFPQKVDLKNVNVEYLLLPLEPLDKAIKTYKPVLNISLENEEEKEKLLKQYIKLEGFSKTKENEDLIIQADVGEFSISNIELNKDEVYQINNQKMEEGYSYFINCSFPISYMIVTEFGEIICDEDISPPEKTLNFEFGKWQSSEEELKTKYEAEKGELFTELKDKCLKTALRKIRDSINNIYGYQEIKDKIKIATGKGKKIDYSDLEEAFLSTESAFNEISKGQPTESIIGELNKAINIWLKAAEEVSKDKKARINESFPPMLYYNCAVAYLWLNDFNNAYKYVSEAESILMGAKSSPANFKKLVAELKVTISDREKRFIANK